MSGNTYKTAPPHSGSTAYINARIIDPTADSEYRGAVLISDGKIADFRLAGDFFLEPDDALDDINAAVTGLPETADVGVIAAAVRGALPEGAQLLGFTPESVGQLSPECQHRFDRGFIRVLVRRLHAAHEALAHPRRIL